MTLSDRNEASAVLRAVLSALLAAGGNHAGQEGADVRRLIGRLSAEASDQVEIGSFGTPLRACFQAATAAGATFAGMGRVHAVASSFTSSRVAVIRVAQTCIRYALVEMCAILAASSYKSRADAESALARVNAAFGPAEEFAADQRSVEVYRALVALHAAAARDLTQRVRQLPRIVAYSFARRMPALTLANRIYGDGGRFSELTEDNRVVHPLFAPSRGLALAV